MKILNVETKKYLVKTITTIALAILLSACTTFEKTKSQQVSPIDYSAVLAKRLTDPCYDLGGVMEKDFLNPPKPDAIWSKSVFTETNKLPVSSLDIMNGLDKGGYALNYEYYTYNSAANCVIFRSFSIVNVTHEPESAVKFDMETGKSITDKGVSENGNVIALYDLTNPVFTPATHTPEFQDLGVDPRLFKYMQLHPGQMLLKITLNKPAPNTDNDLTNSFFRKFEPIFSFYQLINTPPDQEHINLQSLIYKLTPLPMSDQKKFVVQKYGN